METNIDLLFHYICNQFYDAEYLRDMLIKKGLHAYVIKDMFGVFHVCVRNECYDEP